MCKHVGLDRITFREKLKLTMWQRGHSSHTATSPTPRPPTYTHTYTQPPARGSRSHASVLREPPRRFLPPLPRKVTPASASVRLHFLRGLQSAFSLSFLPFMQKFFKTFDSIRVFKVSLTLKPKEGGDNLLLDSYRFTC